MRPQRHLSADAQVFFGPTMGADEEAHKLADFYAWFRASELPARGWSEGADELSLGRIPVADLRRDTDELFGLSDEQVVEKVARFQQIVSMRAVPRAPAHLSA